jgi:hypothetical protein
VFAGWHRPIDLLVVHGASANLRLRLDLALWVPLVRPGGWICGEGYVEEFPDVEGEVDRLAAAFGTQPEITGTFWAVQVTVYRKLSAC